MALKTRSGKGSPLTASDHDNNLLGGQGVPVASITALEALDTSTVADGLTVLVRGYATPGDGGGGFFVFDANSTEESDGITYFVPGNLQSSQQTVSLARAALRADLPNVYIGHANLIFGSVEIVYSDGAGSAPSGSFVTDLDLHGMSQAVGGSENKPEIDHLAGELDAYGTGSNIGSHRLRKLLDAHTSSANYTVRYKYATGAGRWRRVLGVDSPYTPAMIGCKPNDPTVNDYDRLAWLFRWAKEDGRDVLIDNWYHRKGPIEWPQGVTVRQTKPWKDAGIKVCPWSTIPAIDHLAVNYDATLPAPTLQKEVLTSRPEEGATSIRIEGLHLHGNVEENDDFLTDPNYDTDDLEGDAGISKQLREAANYCGLYTSADFGHAPDPNLRIYLKDVQIGDYAGSCILASSHDKFFHGDNVAVGVSVSGRVKYGGSGFWRNLWLYGYSRTAVERNYTQQTSGLRYTWNRPDGSTPVRKWTENAVPENVSSGFDVPIDEAPGLPRGNQITLIDFDMVNSQQDIYMGWNLKGSGNVLQGKVQTPDNGTNPFTVLRFSEDVRVGNVEVQADLDVYCGQPSGVTIATVVGNQCYHTGSDIKMRVYQQFDSTTGNPIAPAPALPTLPAWSPFQVAIVAPTTLRPEAKTDHQHLTLNLYNELASQALLNVPQLPGLGVTVTPSEFLHTTVRLSGRIENVDNKLFRASNSQGPADDVDQVPFRVYGDGLIFKLYDPGLPFVGDTPVVDNCLKVLKLKGSKLTTGEVSEQSGSFSVAGSALTDAATRYYDVQTNLLWQPQSIVVTPTSADSATRYRYVEIIPTSGSGGSTNYIGCTLRFHFDSGTLDGETLGVMWTAAVSPY